MVLATQNPVEHEGTFPLPEAQLDRFLLKIVIGYPRRAPNWRCSRFTSPASIRSAVAMSAIVEPVITADEARACRALVDQVRVAPEVREYIASITRATREDRVARAGRVAASERGADASGARGRRDRGPGLRHAGRREGATRSPCFATASSLAPELEVEGRTTDDVFTAMLTRDRRADVRWSAPCRARCARAGRWWTVYPTPRLRGGRARAWRTLAASLRRPALAVATGWRRSSSSRMAFDYLRLPSRRDLDVERDAPDTLGLGDTGDDHVHASSRDWAWPIALQLFDRHAGWVVGGARTGETVDDCEPRRASAHDRRAGDGRGAWNVAFGDVALRVATPLGLLARIIVARRRSGRERSIVVPSLTNVRRFRLLAMQHRLSDAGVRALKRRGEGNAFAGLRDYVPGDDPRCVDWKATARHGRLISREQTIERSQTVISLIDCGRAMTQLAGRYSRFEHVLSAALRAQRRRGDERRSRRADRVRRPDSCARAPQRGRTALRDAAHRR